MPNVLDLVALLADGRFRSGEQLGQHFGVSRAAVWKSLQKVDELGLELQSVRGKGHRLSRSLELLDVEQIATLANSPHLGAVTVFSEIESTNAYLLRHALELPSGTVCLAERQTAGRGRRGRAWVSPFGSNVYLSALWHYEQGAERLGGLSLAIAVAAANALEQVGAPNIGIKWPNDLVYHGRKLAGILIELSGQADGSCQVVVGIGLNVAMQPGPGRAIDQPWSDLGETGAGEVGRNRVAAALIHHVLDMLCSFPSIGLEGCIDAWRRRDTLVSQPVRIVFPAGEVEGTALGIDTSGMLLVENGQGLQRFASGEVSVRLATRA